MTKMPTMATTNVGLSILLLLGALFVGQGGEARPSDWTTDLIQGIEHNVNHLVNRIHQQVNQITQQIEQDIGNGTTSGYIVTGGNVVITSGNGVSKTVLSGVNDNGEPYVRDIEEKRVGNIVYHNETYYNPNTGKKHVFRYSIDLGNPGSKPVILEDQ